MNGPDIFLNWLQEMIYKKTLIALLLCLVFLVVFFAKVKNTDGDSMGTLLVSEAILTQGSVKLDNYADHVAPKYDYRIRYINKHIYYYFPIGSSIASIPFVAAANAAGYKMIDSEKEVQTVIAAFTSALTVFLLYSLATLFLPPSAAFVASSVFWFGSSFSSTSGTSLWSHNFATLFALLAIFYSVKISIGSKKPYWGIISFALFFAYLCRPTLALLSPFVLVFIFSYSRVAAFKTALLLAFFLALFFGFSFFEYGSLLPDYYLPKRLSGDSFSDAIYGNLFSPSRGLFVFSPFIFVAWLCSPWAAREFKFEKPWLLLGLIWPVVHLVTISRFPHWWGGHSYGSRLMLDALPGIYLLTLRVWPVFTGNFKSMVAVFVLSVSSFFAIYVNAYKGLFDDYTVQWNKNPDVDIYTGNLFDWKYPQFLHSEQRQKNRLADFEIAPSLKKISHKNSPSVTFVGWSEPEGDFRWSSDDLSSIYFPVERSSYTGSITILATYLGQQRVTVTLNGFILGNYSSQEVRGPISIKFNPNLLEFDGLNTLEFRLPDARMPGNGDVRVLAMALREISFR